MNWSQLVLNWGMQGALVVTIVGLFVRRRAAMCWTFVLYAAVVLGCEALITLWPSHFFTPEFWMLKQGLYDAVKVGIALELAYQVLRAFPGAMRTARRWVLLLLAGSTAAIVVGPWSAEYRTVAEWQPRILLGVVWLFSLTALVVLWYRLPVRWWHRAILIGFPPYMLIFTVMLNLLRVNGWSMAYWVNLVDGVAYFALTLWWAAAAWRPEPAPAAVPVALRRLGLEGA